MISSLYAALLAIIFIVLTLRTIKIRRREKISLGDNGNVELQRAIRAHGNFCETVPIALILLVLAEASGASSAILHICAIILLVGRTSHAFGISSQNSSFYFRVGGMILTISSITILAALNILLFLMSY